MGDSGFKQKAIGISLELTEHVVLFCFFALLCFCNYVDTRYSGMKWKIVLFIFMNLREPYKLIMVK